MSGELEAAGAMATAGLAAGAIEGREAHAAGEGVCLNCGVTLVGPYCSRCGQAAHAHRTLSHMFEEVLHGLIHFDTKAWRTLPMLAFRPGTLTRNYIYGKRARYISPLALFLFTIFFMFFVFAFADVNVLNVNTTESREDARVELEQAREALAEAERELAAARTEAPDRYTGDLQARLAQQAVELARAEVQRREQVLERAEAADASVVDGEPTAPQTASETGVSDGEETWQDAVRQAARDGNITVGTPFPKLNERILHSLENPDLALYKVQQAAYKFSFLLVPISLPFLWLLFIWRGGLTLYDHMVFILYSLSFASLVFVFLALVSDVPWVEWLGAVVLAGLPVHMFFHLKGAYALSWWSALWRVWFLFISAILALSLFVLAIVLLGLGG